MVDRPIIMSAPMVRALLDGRKRWIRCRRNGRAARARDAYGAGLEAGLPSAGRVRDVLVNRLFCRPVFLQVVLVRLRQEA